MIVLLMTMLIPLFVYVVTRVAFALLALGFYRFTRLKIPHTYPKYLVPVFAVAWVATGLTYNEAWGDAWLLIPTVIYVVRTYYFYDIDEYWLKKAQEAEEAQDDNEVFCSYLKVADQTATPEPEGMLLGSPLPETGVEARSKQQLEQETDVDALKRRMVELYSDVTKKQEV